MVASVQKNAAYMTAASVAQKAVSFLYFTIVARALGAEATGAYFFALSFTTIFVVFVDIGFTPIMIRSLAQSGEGAERLLSRILGAKSLLGVLAYAVMIAALYLLGYPAETRELVYVSGITMLFDSLHLTLYGVLRTLSDLRFEAASMVGSQAITMILGTAFLFFRLPPVFLMIAFTVPSMLNAAFAAAILARRHGIHLRFSYDSVWLSHFARAASPFAVAAILARLYSYADSMILSKLAGPAILGQYSIAYKVTFAFQFIPLSLTAALYPRFADAWVRDREKLVAALLQSLRYLLALAAPIAVGIAVLAEDIVRTVYTPDYLPAVLPLQALIFGIIFSFPSFPLGSLLNACHRHRTQTGIIAGVLAFNVALNLFLIPRFGALGAALSATAGNAVLVGAGYIAASRLVAIPHREALSLIFRISVSSALMGAVAWAVDAQWRFGAAILVSIPLYALLMIITRVITRREIVNLAGLLRRSAAPPPMENV